MFFMEDWVNRNILAHKMISRFSTKKKKKKSDNFPISGWEMLDSYCFLCIINVQCKTKMQMYVSVPEGTHNVQCWLSMSTIFGTHQKPRRKSSVIPNCGGVWTMIGLHIKWVNFSYIKIWVTGGSLLEVPVYVDKYPRFGLLPLKSLIHTLS